MCIANVIKPILKPQRGDMCIKTHHRCRASFLQKSNVAQSLPLMKSGFPNLRRPFTSSYELSSNLCYSRDFRINGTRQTGAVRKMKLPFFCLVGAVCNCADAVRLQTAPTGWRNCFFIF